MERVKAFAFGLAAVGLVMMPVATVADQNRIRTEMVENLKAYAVYKMGMYEEAFAKWESLAKRGNAQGILNLANMYQAGKGVPRNLEKALEWYRVGGEQGDPQCLYNVAKAYEAGLGTPADAAKSYHYKQRAAEAGSSQAQVEVAKALKANGKTDRALYWFQRAADNGEAEAKAVLSALKPGDTPGLERTAPEAVKVRGLLSNLDSATNGRDIDLMMDPIKADASIRVKLPEQSGFQAMNKEQLRGLWLATFDQSERYRFTRTRAEMSREEDKVRVVSRIREYLTTGNDTKLLTLDEDLLVDVSGAEPRITAVTLRITPED